MSKYVEEICQPMCVLQMELREIFPNELCIYKICSENSNCEHPSDVNAS